MNKMVSMFVKIMLVIIVSVMAIAWRQNVVTNNAKSEAVEVSCQINQYKVTCRTGEQ